MHVICCLYQAADKLANSLMNRLLLALGFVLLTSSVFADNVDVSASGGGWVCTPESTCGPGTNNGAGLTNYIAGNISGVGQFRNWFEFSVPTITGSLVSATLNVDEPGSPYQAHFGGTLTYAVYGLGAQPTVFTDVTTSNPFGSVNTSSADDGTTLSITLNAAALAAISADQGGNIFIGGIDSGETSSSDAVDFSGAPGNVALDLTTAASAVPEPSSLPLLIIVSLAVVLIGPRLRSLRRS